MSHDVSGATSAIDGALSMLARAAHDPEPVSRRAGVRRAAESVRRALLAGPTVPVVRTVPVVEIPVPTRMVFGNAVRTLAPFVLIRQRALLVQFLRDRAPQTLLWNAVDPVHALALSAFDPVRRGLGRLASALALRLHPAVDAQLAAMDLMADAVDLVAYDQLDAQYPAGMLARFPRARLLVTAREWRRYASTAPDDRDLLVPTPEIHRSRVEAIDGARLLGDGVAVIQTGGRREGHQILAVHSARGLLVASGSAAALDQYAPALSGLPGLARRARRDQREYVGAFPAHGDASESMFVESLLADRLPGAPGFPFVLPAEEMIPSLLAPGLTTAAESPMLTLGTIIRGRARR